MSETKALPEHTESSNSNTGLVLPELQDEKFVEWLSSHDISATDYMMRDPSGRERLKSGYQRSGYAAQPKDNAGKKGAEVAQLTDGDLAKKAEHTEEGDKKEDNNTDKGKGLTVDEKEGSEKDNENKKETWPEWAQKNNYAYDNKRDGEEIPGYHKVTSPEGKESEILEEGDTRKVKSQDFSVYQKIVKDAQFDKYDYITIGEHMSPEQTSLLAAACLEKGMSFEPKDKTIDLSLDCMKGLSPELVEKINKHNQEVEANKQKEGKGRENPEAGNAGDGKNEDTSKNGQDGDKKEEPTQTEEKAMSGEKMSDVRAHIAERKRELQERKALREMNGDKGKVSGTVIADKIAEKRISGEVKETVTPKKGDELSSQITQQIINNRKQNG